MKNTGRLPNVRNLGIALRMLIIANAALILIAYTLSINFADFLQRAAEISTFAQPMLLASLLTLYGVYPVLI